MNGGNLRFESQRLWLQRPPGKGKTNEEMVEVVSQRANVTEEGSLDQVPWCDTAGRDLVSRSV